MTSLADALEFLKQGFNGQGAITQYGDGFSSAQTADMNEYRPGQSYPVVNAPAPVVVSVDPSSMPIDLRDFTGAGSVDQNAMQSQDNMQPIDRVAAGVKTGDTPAQAASKTANAKKSAIGTEDFTKGVVNNPKPQMIALDPAGASVSSNSVPTSNEAGFYGDEGSSNADPRIATNIAAEKAASGVDPQSMLAASKLPSNDSGRNDRVNSQDMLKGKMPNLLQILSAIPAGLEATGPSVTQAPAAVARNQAAFGNQVPGFLEALVARAKAGNKEATDMITKMNVAARAF